MILRPRLEDLKIIGFYLGKIIFGLGLIMIIPLILGLSLGEINPALDFTITILFCFSLALILNVICYTEKDLSWMQGMLVVSLCWLVGMLISAIPLYLSGHFASFLDACFDGMSGFATTGLTLIQDLDHLSYSHNFFRHLIMFVGGQGIVVIALTFLVRGASGAFKMYVGEAREERVLPNIISTARFIWGLSLVYLLLGSMALAIVANLGGIPFPRALFHGICIFMAAFDTGGFAPQSQNVLYYHSLAFEITTMVIMILGAINFNLHYVVLTGNRKEIYKNIEIRTFLFTVMVALFAVFLSLKNTTYFSPLCLFRKGFYQLISAHTGTGYVTVYSQQFIREWTPLALVFLILAMSLGGGTCSTTGGIKSLRIGLFFKAILQDVKRIILPESTQVFEKFHHIKEIILEDRYLRTSLLVFLAYLFLYGLGTVVGVALGYPFLESLFESTSAGANVGLSCGITTPEMPNLLKIVYIFQMWTGRLEFMSVFTLVAVFVAAVRGR